MDEQQVRGVVDTLVEIELTDPQNFLKVKETLTRIGVASRTGNKLFQTCHILHKRGKFYITHFKQMFQLDGKPTDFTLEDEGRLNSIAIMLEQWGLIKIVNPMKCLNPRADTSTIRILAFKEKHDWQLVPKYTIGRR